LSRYNKIRKIFHILELEFVLESVNSLRIKTKDLYVSSYKFDQNEEKNKEMLLYTYHNIDYIVTFNSFDPKDFEEFAHIKFFYEKSHLFSFLAFDNKNNFNGNNGVSSYKSLDTCNGNLEDTFLFMFFIEDIIEKHMSEFKTNSYIFTPTSEELNKYYSLLLRKYMCHSDRRLNAYYHTIAHDDGEVAYYEICK